jgi:glutathione-specific gamma-glutamylcyclotransferase
MTHWVFGFGSLMWAPGFEYVERQPALLNGWHRAFSIASTQSWGSADRPGLVVALHPGGRCRGCAFRIAADQWPVTESYLKHRERAYRHARLSIHLDCSPDTSPDTYRVSATTFLFDPKHPRAAGKLDVSTTAQMIAQGVGDKGSSYDYLSNIIIELEKMGRPAPRNLMRIKALIQNTEL